MSWKLGAAVERLAVGLDRLAQLAGLAIGVAERGLEVGELAARRGVERAGRERAADATRSRSRASARTRPALVDARERHHRLGVARVQPQRLAQALRGRVEVVALLVQDADHVVDVGEARRVSSRRSSARSAPSRSPRSKRRRPIS